MFPYFAIFGIWCEDKVNNYRGYSAMQMGLFYKPCKDRETERQRREIWYCHYQTLLSLHLMCIRNNFSEAHQSQLRP